MEYIERELSAELLESSREMPLVAILGPRQSGKSTLAKLSFPEKEYISLEDIDAREFATQDPIGFLKKYKRGAIFDEIQRVPSLFSYLQTEVDNDDAPGRYILTGSHQFSLVERITQSLAGRIRLLRLLPLSFDELGVEDMNLEKLMFCGMYPRIHHRNLRPSRWLADYFETYIQKDVRMIKNIGDLDKFVTFVKMLAARAGQILNLSSLGNDCGISHNTAQSWLTVLEGSYIVFTLQPHHKNFNKRLVKSPKVYFYDSGLLCYLLNITKESELATHSLRGGIFEGMMLTEILKYYYNIGMKPPLYFWRDKIGNEIDGLLEYSQELVPVEIKSGQTINASFFKGLNYWQKIASYQGAMYLLYGGDESYLRSGVHITSWRQVTHCLQK